MLLKKFVDYKLPHIKFIYQGNQAKGRGIRREGEGGGGCLHF